MATNRTTSSRARRRTGHRVRARWLLVGVFAVAILGAQFTQPRADAGAAYQMIVNPTNHEGAIERTFVAQAFLKKVRSWPNGDAIQPVDLIQASAVRHSWSRDLLGRPVEAVKNYWEQMIFSGRDLPPPEMASDEDVVSYVLKRPGSIGYVAAGTNLRGARVLGVK